MPLETVTVATSDPLYVMPAPAFALRNISGNSYIIFLSFASNSLIGISLKFTVNLINAFAGMTLLSPLLTIVQSSVSLIL